MKKVLVTKDLFFITKVREVAIHLGVELVVVKSESSLASVTISEPVGAVVMIDLEKPGVEVTRVMQHFSDAFKAGARNVGFFSHVHEEVAQKGIEHGIADVMPRSQFVKVLPELLSS